MSRSYDSFGDALGQRPQDFWIIFYQMLGNAENDRTISTRNNQTFT